MASRLAPIQCIVLILCTLAAGCDDPKSKPVASRLQQDVYVWQRSWNQHVLSAIQDRATNFNRVICLAAEVTWDAGEPKVIRVLANWEELKRAGVNTGFAVRIGPFAGPFSSQDARARFLAELCTSIIKDAAGHGITPCELQIDFDCAESKLEGYRAWVMAIRERVSPTPLVLTALPAWLDRPEFEPLVQAAGSYVLQVHSLERPKHRDAVFTLCDPALARRAISRAGRMGVSFRVALPTYGYLVAFDKTGRFAGLSAEGPARGWEPGTDLREVRSDAKAIAELVRAWELERPSVLKGLIWYRLPVERDQLNWSWPTLVSVMRGEVPGPGLRVQVREPQPALYEFDLVNDGAGDFVGQPEVRAEWTGMPALASDALRGFELEAAGSNAMSFRHPRHSIRIRPQERQMIGWLRLAGDVPVSCEILLRNDDAQR